VKIDPEELGLKEAHDLSTSIIAPRPIAFISTIGEDGIFNLAPFSAYAPISIKPTIACFAVVPRRSGQKKDTLTNVEFSKDFVINTVTESLAAAMNQTAAEYPSSVDEFKEVGLTPLKSDIVVAPRLAESPVNMECKLLKIEQFGNAPQIASLIIGEVVLIHIRDEYCADGSIHPLKLKLIGRLGGDFYCRTTDIFQMWRPELGK
jgi:flavin reductase (DIM6/NTAB) family NADH-FMN oxidoreductase RutF